jgi:hypothetical protein
VGAVKMVSFGQTLKEYDDSVDRNADQLDITVNEREKLRHRPW